jgi:hypothetical protein
MNGWVLFVIGLASLGLVCVAFGYVGYAFYRLGKAGLGLGRTYGPLTADLAHKAAIAEQHAAQAGVHGDDIMFTLERLQGSLQRLQIVAEAWQTARAPYDRLLSYFGR